MADALQQQLQHSLGDAYVIERELGGGGMSRVFLATETALDRRVVIKLLPPEMAASVSVERFKREIHLAARLQHAHVVPLLSAGDANGLPWFTMPFVEGESLRQRLEQHGELPVAEAVRVLREIASALAYAHDHGVVHRDIKPDNVMLSGGAAMVTDFGVAKALSSSTNAEHGFVTSLGVALGTPAYMSPEQVSADPALDHRADIYAFGVLAYEMLTGETPFGGRTPQGLLAAHVTEVPEFIQRRRATVPQGLADLVMRCLEKRPADRPQSATEIVHALDEVGTPRGGVAPLRARGRPDGTAHPHRVRAAITVGIVVAIVALLGAGGIIWRRATRATATADGMPRSVAVLPFENIGRDTSDAYFADGMAEELRIALAKVSGLTVTSRSAAAGIHSRGGSDPSAEARRVNVGALLEGTVRRDRDRLRLTAQLTRTDDGSVLWTESYEQSATDVFAVQDSVARAIVSALRVRLVTPSGTTPASMLAKGTRNVESYDLYLRGRYLLARRENLPRAIELFGQSIAGDSSFARSYAGLAMAYSVLPLYTHTATLDVIPLGIAAGRRAIELDPALSDAELALANMLELDFQWAEAEAHFKRALALDDGNAAAHEWYGDLLYVTGRLVDAEAQIRRAVALDPMSAVMANDLAYTLALAHRHAESAEFAARSMKLDSTYLFARGNYSTALAQMGQRDSARVMLRPLAAHQQDPTVYQASLLPRILLGDTPKDREHVLDELRRETSASDRGSVSRYLLTHGVLGHGDSASVWLGRAIDRHAAILFSMSIPCERLLDPVRADPSFQGQLRRMGVGECKR